MRFTTLAVLLIVIFLFVFHTHPEGETHATMYGSYNCPHCIDQKTKILPGSYEYIECDLPGGQAAVCVLNKIAVYPTWTFLSGCRVEGEISQTQFNELKNGGVCP